MPKTSRSRQALEAELKRLQVRMDKLSASETAIATSGWTTTPATRDIFFAALEKTRMPMILTDPNQPDDPIVFANRAFQDLSGYAADELEGRNCRFLQGSGTNPEDIVKIRQALDTGSDIAIELLNYRKDGTPFWNELYITSVFSNDGKLLYRFGSQVNVTRWRHERRRSATTEATLRSRNRRLEKDISERTHERDHIWMLVPDLLVLAAFDGQILQVNPAWTTVLGHDEDMLLSRPIWDFIHPDCLDEIHRAIDEMRHGRAVRHQSRVRDADGAYRWFEWVSAPEDDQFYAVARDITEQREGTAALRVAKEEAEKARIQAEAANKAKSEFLASMSHEIRTPLHGVLGYADILTNARNLTSVQHEQLTKLRTAGSALLTIVNDILDFAKIEAGQIELERRPFSLKALVDNSTSIVRSLAKAKGLELNVDVEPDLEDWRTGDEDRLRQVLLNLLNNSIKFTPSGSVTLKVERAPPPGESDSLIFSVEDTGIGIPSSKLYRLFERFSQVDGSIRRDFGGTGLGLAICKRLIELMEGTIDVRSEAGRGSTFFFTVLLPYADSTTRGRLQTAAPSVPRTSNGALVLVADDVEMNQEIARTVLEDAGHVVDVVSDGAEAVRAVQDKDYDLVLMDIQMPVMDGLTATEHIRSLRPPASRVPIVAMTANVLPQQIMQFRAAGLDDHVGKPFKQNELCDVVARWRRRVWRVNA